MTESDHQPAPSSAAARPSAPQRPQLVLIGPAGVGKTTVGRVVATELGRTLVDLDSVAREYYSEAGRPLDEFVARMTSGEGRLAAYRWWEPALPYAVERVFADNEQDPISLGAGHSHFEDPDLFDRVRRALSQVRIVVLLLPSPDAATSITTLRERSVERYGHDWNWDGYDFIEHWVCDTCNTELATHVVFTHGKGPTQTAAEVLDLLKASVP